MKATVVYVLSKSPKSIRKRQTNVTKKRGNRKKPKKERDRVCFEELFEPFEITSSKMSQSRKNTIAKIFVSDDYTSI